MIKQTAAAATALVILSTAVLPAQQAGEASESGQWIHVRVDEADGAEVSLNLPISMMDVALRMAEREGFDEEDLELDRHSEIRIQDLREMWREMRDAGDAEFVNVKDDGEHVRIYRQGERVHVHVDEDGKQKVRVDLPASIVDALLGTEGGRLQLRAAARELGRSGQQEVVRIDDEGTRVRIWVDDQSSGE